MNRKTNLLNQWLGIAVFVALLTMPTSPVLSAKSNETDLNKQQVTPKDSSRASSPAKDDVIYDPPSGSFKSGKELQNERERKMRPDREGNDPRPTEVPPPMPETR